MLETMKLNTICPNQACGARVDFEVSQPEIANTELASVLVFSHADQIRCRRCFTKLLPVLTSANVASSNWVLLPTPDEAGKVIELPPGSRLKPLEV